MRQTISNTIRLPFSDIHYPSPKEYTPDFLAQKKIKSYGEIELTQVRGTHETIVTEEKYERVQLIMESKRKECKNLNQGRSTGGKRPRTTVWGKPWKTDELQKLQRKRSRLIDMLSEGDIDQAAFREKLEVLQYALAQYTNWDEQNVPPNVIEGFVVKIVVNPEGFDWYLRFNGDPEDPLKCIVEGKRQKSAQISTLGGIFAWKRWLC